jgi:ribosome-binding factor A
VTSEKRQQRVRGLLIEELSILVGSELEDPKLSFVTVTDVVVSKDLHNVRVFVNHQDENVSKQEILSHLEKAIPFVRGKIAERLTLRTVPEISFAYDESALRAERLTQLLGQIAEERAATQGAGDASQPAATGTATDAASHTVSDDPTS